jgi:hypothetical protein
MDARAGDRRTEGRVVAPLSLLVALLANLSNLFNIAGVFTGPLAFAFAAFVIWRARGWARVIATYLVRGHGVKFS